MGCVFFYNHDRSENTKKGHRTKNREKKSIKGNLFPMPPYENKDSDSLPNIQELFNT